MIVRSRGGWLRRVIASSATFVALGAVLVGPQIAHAAPADDEQAPIALDADHRCGFGHETLPVTGVIPRASGGAHITALRADGTSAGPVVSISGGQSAGPYSASVEVDAGSTQAVVLYLVLEPIPIAPRIRAAATAGVTAPSGAAGHVWYLNGCARVDTNPSHLQNGRGTPKLKLNLSSWTAGRITLSAPGRTITPSTVDVSDAGLSVVDVTLDAAPCTPSVLTIHADQASPGDDIPGRQADTSVRIWCPTLTATPGSVSDVDLPTAVTISGAGWFPNDRVSIYLDGALLTNSDFAASRGGSFSAAPSFPQLDCGTHTITAAQFPSVISFAPPRRLARRAAAAMPDDPAAELFKEIPFEVSCAKGELDVYPGLLLKQDAPEELDLRLRNFVGGRAVDISLPGVTITPGQVVPANTSGWQNFSITLNHQPACGSNKLTVSQPQHDDALPPKTATTTIYVLCPSLTATPDTVAEVNLPETLTLGGGGWFPKLAGTVLWDGKKIGTTTPSSAGQLSGTVDIPRSKCGTHRLEVLQTVLGESQPDPDIPSLGHDLDIPAATPITVPCATPQISVLPQVLASKPTPPTVDVKISGFLQGIPAGIVWPEIPVNPAEITPSRASPGEAAVTLTKAPTCGRTTVRAVQKRDDVEFPVDREALTLVQVFCPTFAPAPAVVLDGKLPGPVGATGTGWVPNQPIRLLLDKRIVATITVTDGGSVTGSPKLPRSACGKHALEAVQVTPIDADPAKTHLPALFEPFELRAQAQLLVACPPATLAVNPGVVVDGNTTEAAGVGFAAGRRVILQWTYADGTVIGDACEATASAGGTFIVNCLVLPNTSLGGRLLHAVEIRPPGDPVVARKADAPLLVVPGSMDRDRQKHGRFLERR